MQPLKEVTAILIFSSMLILFACKKDKEPILTQNQDLPKELIIEAKVPSILYTNKKEIVADASAMKKTYDKRTLKFLWTCTQFPTDKKPNIIYPESVSTPVNNLTLGKYIFHLWAKDHFGNEANADYQLTVYQDTLSGPPVIPAMPAIKVHLPEPVVLIRPDLSMNPVGRELKLDWTVIEQPASSPTVDISYNGFNYEGRGCVPGKYIFQLEVTNELNLKASRQLEITVLADVFAGTTRIYENLQWTAIEDDGIFYSYIGIVDPQISFTYRNNTNTEISLWDFTNQVWMTPNTLTWSGFNDYVVINNYPPLSNISNGTPARVRIKFK